MKETYIKIFRSILDWEWYGNTNVKVLFLHLLLRANFIEKQWRGITVKEGEYITGRNTLSRETGLTTSQIRVALSKLKSTGEISIKTTNKFSIIKLNNWSKYNGDSQQISSKSPTNLQQISTTEEIKKDNNILLKENNIKEKSFFENKTLDSKFIEFINHRKEIGKPLKKTGLESNVKKITDWLEKYSIDEICSFIDLTISNGWQGIFEKKKDKRNQTKPKDAYETEKDFNFLD